MAAAVLLLARHAVAFERYTITDLGPRFYPSCINNLGEIAGKSYLDQYPYRYSNGTFTRFGTTNTRVEDINDCGEILTKEGSSAYRNGWPDLLIHHNDRLASFWRADLFPQINQQQRAGGGLL